MNRFKLFKNNLDDFYIQLKQNDKGEDEALKSVTGFIGYITFKEFNHE